MIVRFIYKGNVDEDLQYFYFVESMRQKFGRNCDLKISQVGNREKGIYSVEIGKSISENIFRYLLSKEHGVLPIEIFSTSKLDCDESCKFVENQLKGFGLMNEKDNFEKYSKLTKIERILISKEIGFERNEQSIFLKS